MRLYIMRHGQAERSFGDDTQRALTAVGIEQIKTVCQLWQAKLQAPVTGRAQSGIIEAIWASPYLRTQQTAQYTKQNLNLASPIITQPALTPDSSVENLIQLIESAGINQLLLVSHQPLVGVLFSALSNKYPPMLDPSHIVAFEGEHLSPANMDFLWHIYPELA